MKSAVTSALHVLRRPNFSRTHSISATMSTSVHKTKAAKTDVFIGVVARANNPGLAYVPDSLTLSSKNIHFQRLASPADVQSKGGAYATGALSSQPIDALLYIPPGETDTLEDVWQALGRATENGKNVPWMHCFL